MYTYAFAVLESTSGSLYNTENNGWSNLLNTLGRSFLNLLIFAMVVAMAYFFTKWLSGSVTAKKRGNNIQIVESCTIGFQCFIQLIKVADKYILIGVSKDKVTFLTEIDAQSVTEDEKPNIKELYNKIPFDKYLGKYFNKE